MDDGSLELAMREHEEGLAAYSIDKINWAFKEWRHDNTKFPWFADIRKLIESKSFHGEGKLKKYGEWGGDWDSYKHYLAEHNALNLELEGETR